jgi:DCN1-like protein 1/2
MWQLLYADERRWQYIDEWCEFLQSHHNRAISKDTWVQLFQFTRVSSEPLYVYMQHISVSKHAG